MSVAKTKINLLLVEDNRADAQLVKELFACPGFECEFSTVRNGKAAISFLKKQAEYVGVVRPDLILLDLNLPRLGGKEVLQAAKSDAGLREIPVIILSSSNNPHEIRECYALGANAFVCKPVGLDQFDESLKNLALFWIKTATINERLIRSRT